MRNFSKIINFFITCFHYIIPDFCALCELSLESTLLLCKNCLTYIQPVASKTIFLGKKSKIVIHALSLYKEELKPLIHAKFYKNQALLQELGLLLWKHSDIKNLEFDIIVPIPLHWTRYASRGFNQAEEIAKSISHQSGKPIVHLLSRQKKTVFQATLNKKERLKNVHSAFVIALSISDHQKYKNAHILIVDDLYTTGATVMEAVSTLQLLNKNNTIFNVSVICRT